MMWVDVVSRVVHVGTAIALVGGSVFTLFVLLPAAKLLSPEAHETLASGIGARWKRFVHLGVLLFLASGFYNYFQAIPLHKGDGLYHALVGTKILLALFVFFVSAALVGRSAGLQAIRDQREKWLKILVLVAAIIVCISGFVKVRGTTSLDAAEVTVTEPEVAP
ncbi:hypothetical protein [Aureliella helgolandensis]|uniref:Copper resistance protein D n=1 Tax=Aureliella helgolandensis TaxID=2527968 RepID=A0A518G7Y2_9BACT|nr:hypothetical protein [Aureliella helgolandensis]QDV24691.1 hypothetical protein Q31a_30120 [Aureliella helgolandensis]